jgi:hypothetical protein
VYFAFKDKDHAIGGLALFKEDVSGLSDNLFAVLREPETVFERQAL